METYGSYPCGLSTKSSDLDLRVNDQYTYCYLNLDKVSKLLTYVPYEQRGGQEWWSSSREISRLRVVEHLKQARVPVLKMKDSKTGIEFDITTGASFVNNRHIQICKKAAEIYPSFR